MSVLHTDGETVTGYNYIFRPSGSFATPAFPYLISTMPLHTSLFRKSSPNSSNNISMRTITCNSHRKFRPIQIHSIPLSSWKNLLPPNCMTRFATKRTMCWSERQLQFLINDNGLLIRTVQDPPQKMVPQNLKKKVLHASHQTVLAGHPGGQKLYHRIMNNYYCPLLTVNCFTTVRLCPHCAQNLINLRMNIGHLKWFPASCPIESVCIDILGELVCTPHGNRYLFVIVDRFMS